MTARADDILRALTEKEKQTLRLIVRGHDAKSIARELSLSVHTINERLRDARRKLAVSSSREAARRLFETEGGTPSMHPQSLGDDRIGTDGARALADREIAPDGVGRRQRGPQTLVGVTAMTLALGLLAILAAPSLTPAPPQAATAAPTAVNAEVVDAARAWLVLLDGSRWEESYRATGSAFRKLNTVQVWAAASEKVRVPLGAALSRTLVSQEEMPAPPRGYEVVKFRTVFANKAEAIETVTLDREDGAWRVVGVFVS